MPLLADPALVITFKRPFRDVTKETLFLTNTEAEPVLFKVKTTNPKQYCVRPASGFIEPNERKEITIMLQPLKDEPSPKSRDRFLIQSRSYPGANDSTNVNDAWESSTSAVDELRFKVAFAPADSTAAPSPAAAVSKTSEPAATADKPTSGIAPSASSAQIREKSESALKTAFEENRTLKADNENLRHQLKQLEGTGSGKGPAAVNRGGSAKSSPGGLFSNISFVLLVVVVAFAVGLQLGHTFLQ